MQTVTIRTPGDLRTIRARLDNPRPLLASISLQLKRTSDKAFQDQRLGEIPWAARYPSQGEPFVNYAAVLARANRGQAPLARDFDRRPALRGTGELQKSVHTMFGVTNEGAVVTAKSDLAYAGLHQHGGETSIEVSQGARDILRTWALKRMEPLPGAPKRRGRKAKLDPRAKKILLLSYLHTWKQSVIPRPFIGITDEAGKTISAISEVFFASGDA